MSPITATLIIAAFVGVAGILVLIYLNSDNAKTADNSEGNETGKKTASATEDLPDWARLQPRGKVWETEADRAETWQQLDDPQKDGWDTEVFNNQVNEQFAKLKKRVVGGESLTGELLNDFATDEFKTDPLRPSELKTTFQDDVLHIQKAELEAGDVPTSNISSSSQAGPDQLAEALTQFFASYADAQRIRLKIKVFRIKRNGDQFETRQSVEVFGPTSEGLMEENAIWTAKWIRRGDLPLLQGIQVVEYESVQRKGSTLFADVTESVLEQNSSYRNQVLLEYDHYLDRLQYNRFNSILGNPGIAIGDVNGDGLEDVYFCQESGLPNLLYLQNADGTVRDASRESGADWLQHSSSALIVDVNNDGKNDLVVGVSGGVVIAEGDGNAKFQIRTILDSDDHITGLAAADYDRDGWLDIYAAVYYPDGIDRETEDIVASSSSETQAYGDAQDDGGSNSLFRNQMQNGEWKFADVTESVGLDQNNLRLSLAASWEDYDNDGDQDLYVANDYGLNNLYRNEQQDDGSIQFVDIADAANAEDSAFGMSVTWGDYDRDGWIDLYISNMFSYAGNRITFQDQFHAGSAEQVRRGYQRFARGNTLLKNIGQPDENSPVSFADLSLEEHVNKGRWAWGSRFIDVNNDGWDDLVIANGYITTADTGDL